MLSNEEKIVTLWEAKKLVDRADGLVLAFGFPEEVVNKAEGVMQARALLDTVRLITEHEFVGKGDGGPYYEECPECLREFKHDGDCEWSEWVEAAKKSRAE